MIEHEEHRGAIVAAASSTVDRRDLLGLLEVESLLRQHGTALAHTHIPSMREIPADAAPAARAAEVQFQRECLERMLHRAAALPALMAMSEALERAVATDPDEGVIEACLAALIDTRVKLPHNLPIYLEALIYDLKDEAFPPAVVAAACQKIRRENVFLPEISEVIATCREILRRYREEAKRTEAAIGVRRSAERWLESLKQCADASAGVSRRGVPSANGDGTDAKHVAR